MPANSTPTQDSCICVYASGLRRIDPDPDHLTIEVAISHGAVISRPGRMISPKVRSGRRHFFRHPRRAFLSSDRDAQRNILSTIIRGLQTPLSLQQIHWTLNDFPHDGDAALTLDEIIDGKLVDVARRCAQDGRITSVDIRIRKLERVDEFPSGRDHQRLLDQLLGENPEIENRYCGVRAEEGEGEMEECAICMGGFVKGKKEIRMPCKHIFHRLCILTWLQKVPTCPLCRFWLSTKSTSK